MSNPARTGATFNNAIDELEIKGWTDIGWPESSSLGKLARLFFSKASEHEKFKFGSVVRLTATASDKARSGRKSSIRGLRSFPPHTDEAWRSVPPRYILFRSISGQSESPTEITPFDVGGFDKNFLSDLKNGLWACHGLGESRICSVWNGRRVRWDEDCMRPLDCLAKRAHPEFIEYLHSAASTDYQWNDRSSVLLIDNWKILHARTAVMASEHREIERLYVEMK